jgi:hypothetical protein
MYASLFSFVVTFCTALLLLATQVQAAGGYKVMHIGNSLIMHEGPPGTLEGLAKGAGYTSHYHLISWLGGSNIEWLWKNEASTADPAIHYTPEYVGWGVALHAPNTWDFLMLEPYSGWLVTSLKADSTYGSLFYDSALTLNPNTKLIIYQHWPLNGTTWATSDFSRKISYFESVANAIQKSHPTKTVLITPVGMVFDSTRRLADKGLMPGMTSGSDLFDPGDTQHQSPKGVWLIAVVWYATIYQKDPSPLPNSGFPGTAAAATAIKTLAWNIVKSYTWAKIPSTAIRQSETHLANVKQMSMEKGDGLFDLQGEKISGNQHKSGLLIVTKGMQPLRMQFISRKK